MKLIKFDELNSEEFYISDVASFYRKPDYDYAHEKNCPYSGFRIVENGKAYYSFNKKTHLLKEGALIYMPKGCSMELTIDDKDFSFSKVHFSLFSSGGEEFVFSNTPVILTENASSDIIEAIHTLNENTQGSYDTIINKLCLCKILKEITHFQHSAVESKLSPAIKYIRLHYREDTRVDKLASLCYLSKSQFYRLFKKQTGLTTVEYKNALRIEFAIQMIEDGEYSLSEIGTSVGFDSIYYFSEIFKKIKGISPSEYKKQFFNK